MTTCEMPAAPEQARFRADGDRRRIVLVTGSPRWTDRVIVVRALLEQDAIAAAEGREPVLLHGDAPIGVLDQTGQLCSAEAFADEAARALGWRVIRFPADPRADCVPPPRRVGADFAAWSRFDGSYFCRHPVAHRRAESQGVSGTVCPMASSRRNQHMIMCGPDVVIAFPDAAHVRDCVQRAREARIPVIVARDAAQL